MAKREPKQFAPCTHDVAQWRAVGPEHKLRCCRCQETLEREFAEVPRKLNVVLFHGRINLAERALSTLRCSPYRQGASDGELPGVQEQRPGRTRP
jgi:hypothetical protein